MNSGSERRSALAREARTLFDAAVRGAGADTLLASSPWTQAARRPPERYRRVRLVAMGKGALAMTGVAAEQGRAADGSFEAGMAVVPAGYRGAVPERVPAPPPVVDVREGGHPTPTEASVAAGERALALAEASGAEDLLVVLVSGGGTALCNAFADGISLAEARTAFQLLLESGADIHAMNAVRKHLSRVGGGQLARAAAPAEVLALVISDVPGDAPSVIASGPTTPDPTTFADAQRVLRERGLAERVPPGARRHLERGVAGDVADTPKPGDALFRRVQTRLVGTNADALRAMQSAAEERGYAVEREPELLEGEARERGRELARAALRRAAPPASPSPYCRLLGGETTVTVRGGGTGGRNQELALAAALELDGVAEEEAPVALLCAGTDGIDGPTDAAGAVVTPWTAEQIRAAGCDPQARLADNDSHPALEAAGDALLRPGPTHTNVMDVAAVLVE
jgi:hydroxypyruvate reductase